MFPHEFSQDPAAAERDVGFKTMESPAIRRVSITVDAFNGSADRQSTVLLVSGDDDLRAAAARVMSRAGYRVVTAAHSGHAVLACLTACRVDILATELSMDDTSGPRLAERLRRHHPGLQAVYFATGGTPECAGVLVRPFTSVELLAQLEAAVSL